MNDEFESTVMLSLPKHCSHFDKFPKRERWFDKLTMTECVSYYKTPFIIHNSSFIIPMLP